jgi:hypothetical protein
MQHRAEKRRFERVPVELPVEFTARRCPFEGASGLGRDIALGGMFIETTEPVAFGAPVLVSFHVAECQDVMLVPGIVRWTGWTGMGVQFGLYGARETRAIMGLMRSRSGVHLVG